MPFLKYLIALISIWLAMPVGSLCAQRPAWGQLIRPEYYDARDFFNDGQILQAMDGFAAASSRSRSMNNEHGIDNVPPLVMLGVCKYHQGLIAEALSSLDTALEISIRADGWIDHLQTLPGIATRIDPRTKEILWADLDTVGGFANSTNAWPTTLGSNEMLLELNGNQGVVGRLVSIDAFEILRCQAVALKLRQQLLGPLTAYHPMSEALIKTFARSSDRIPEVIIKARQVCHAIALASAGKKADAVHLLDSNVNLSNGMIHPLSAIGYLAASELALDIDDMVLSRKLAIQASMAAARAEQLDALIQSVELMTVTSAALSDRAATLTMLQRIAEWTEKKGRMANLSARAAWLQLQAGTGESTIAKDWSVSLSKVLQQPNIDLPKLEAIVLYSRAQDAFGRYAIAEGIAAIEEAILTIQNDQRCTPRAYQAILANELIKNGSIKPEAGLPLLAGLVLDSKAGFARTQPLERLAFSKWLQFEGTPALESILTLSNSLPAAERVRLWDALRIERFRRVSPLSGKLLETRLLMHSPVDTLYPHCVREQAQILKAQPNYVKAAQSLRDSVSTMMKQPKWDHRKWNDDDEKKWNGLTRQAMNEESLVWKIATGFHHVPNFFPPPVSNEVLSLVIDPADAIVVVTQHDEDLQGFVWHQGQWSQWTSPVSKSIENQIRVVSAILNNPRSDLGLQSPTSKKLNDALAKLKSTMFPVDVSKTLEAAHRWIVVPEGNLWMLPFELLPANTDSDAYAISAHPISYAPTVGTIPWIFNRESKIAQTIYVHDRAFYSRDNVRTKKLGDELLQVPAVKGTWLEASSCHGLPSLLFKLTSNRVVSLGQTDFVDAVSMALVRTDADVARSRVGTWSELPWGVPPEIWLPGMNAQNQLHQSGDDWLKLTLPMIAQGNHGMLLSRWSVGGESTASMVRTLVESRAEMPAADAWQRTVLSLWEERFNPKLESVITTSKDATELIPGSDPRIWAGYLWVGSPK